MINDEEDRDKRIGALIDAVGYWVNNVPEQTVGIVELFYDESNQEDAADELFPENR